MRHRGFNKNADCLLSEASATGIMRTPLAWFLPGPVCMRGGAARRFASDRHFHRGSQAESTCPMTSGKATHYQRLAESRSWHAGFFAESRESSLRKPPCRKPASGSHCREAIESACIFRLTKLPPLTYPLIIEELRPEDTPRGRFRFHPHRGSQS